MITGKNSQRIAIIALLGTIALHLVLIAAATIWLTVSVIPDQRAPVVIVTLHRPVSTTSPLPAISEPEPVTTPASKPKAAPLAKNSAPPIRSKTVPKHKVRPRPPVAAQKIVPDVSHQPQIFDTPASTPPPQQQIAQSAPSPTQHQTSNAGPASAPEAPPVAAKTGVSIPAAYAARNRKPDYPLMSRRYNEQGTVVLRVLVNADGTAGAVRIKQSSGYPLLDQSALAAARDWRFVAATQDGKPVSEWYEISIPYTLRD